MLEERVTCLPDLPGWREVNGMRLFKAIMEGPRRVRQLDGALLFGHEWIVANPDTRFGVTSRSAVTRRVNEQFLFMPWIDQRVTRRFNTD
jgi:hypothetical protein